MTISFSSKDFDAVFFAIDQIEIDREAASDEEFIHEANEALKYLYSICEKYKKQRFNDKMIRGLMEESKRQGRKMSYKEASKLLREYKILE